MNLRWGKGVESGSWQVARCCSMRSCPTDITERQCTAPAGGWKEREADSLRGSSARRKMNEIQYVLEAAMVSDRVKPKNVTNGCIYD